MLYGLLTSDLTLRFQNFLHTYLKTALDDTSAIDDRMGIKFKFRPHRRIAGRRSRQTPISEAEQKVTNAQM